MKFSHLTWGFALGGPPLSLTQDVRRHPALKSNVILLVFLSLKAKKEELLFQFSRGRSRNSHCTQEWFEYHSSLTKCLTMFHKFEKHFYNVFFSEQGTAQVHHSLQMFAVLSFLLLKNLISPY